MTRKHFEQAAAIVRAADKKHRPAIALAFAELFRSHNPAFDKDRFLAACGLGARK